MSSTARAANISGTRLKDRIAMTARTPLPQGRNGAMKLDRLWAVTYFSVTSAGEVTTFSVHANAIAVLMSSGASV